MPGASEPFGVDERMPLGLDQLGLQPHGGQVVADERRRPPGIGDRGRGWALTLGMRIRCLELVLEIVPMRLEIGIHLLQCHARPPFRVQTFRTLARSGHVALQPILDPGERSRSRRPALPAGEASTQYNMPTASAQATALPCRAEQVREPSWLMPSFTRDASDHRIHDAGSIAALTAREPVVALHRTTAWLFGSEVLLRQQPMLTKWSIRVVGLTSPGQGPYFPKLDSSFCQNGPDERFRSAKSREWYRSCLSMQSGWKLPVGWRYESGRIVTHRLRIHDRLILEFASVRSAA